MPLRPISTRVQAIRREAFDAQMLDRPRCSFHVRRQDSFGRSSRVCCITSCISETLRSDRGIHTHPNPKCWRNNRIWVGASGSRVTCHRLHGTDENSDVAVIDSFGISGCIAARATARPRMNSSSSAAVIVSFLDGKSTESSERSSEIEYSKVNIRSSIGSVSAPMVADSNGGGNAAVRRAAHI